MLNITLCYEVDSELNFIKNEISKCFSHKGISISVNCCHNVNEFKKSALKKCPDIVFYNYDNNNSLIPKAVIYLKKTHPHLISIITKTKDTAFINDDNLLNPIYVLPNKSRKQIWKYASLAYEQTLNDQHAFTYYRRPGYVCTKVDDIFYFSSEGRRTHLYSHENNDTFYKKLDDVELLMQNKDCDFMRIHKSYLVNTKYIKGCNRKCVLLTNGEILRISRYEYYRNLIVKLNPQKIHLECC